MPFGSYLLLELKNGILYWSGCSFPLPYVRPAYFLLLLHDTTGAQIALYALSDNIDLFSNNSLYVCNTGHVTKEIIMRAADADVSQFVCDRIRFGRFGLPCSPAMGSCVADIICDR